MAIYGYVRISTKKQSLERQINNINNYVKENDMELTKLYTEQFTGTKIDGREEFQKLLKKVKENDTIIFDSVSRMSRNAEEGYELYMELYKKGVNLIFLNEMHINTDTYKKALFNNNIEMTNTHIDFILEGVNKFLEELAKEQIKLAFEQSEKEVKDLSKRTSQALGVLKDKGVELGRKKGTTVTTQKSIKAKKEIKKHSKDFGGTLTDVEVMKLLRIARNTYYKYKKELIEECQ